MRNKPQGYDPCYCGSGEIYKRCCLIDDLLRGKLNQLTKSGITSMVELIRELNEYAVHCERMLGGDYEGPSNYEGLGSEEVENLLSDPFTDKSPAVFKLDSIGPDEVPPFVHHFRTFLRTIKENQPISLTRKGNLPRRICRELDSLGCYESEWRRPSRFGPIQSQNYCSYISALRAVGNILELCRETKTRLLLTKKGESTYRNCNDMELYKLLFKSCTIRFNWVYEDGLADSMDTRLIQQAALYSILLLQKYGDKPRDAKFYADKLKEAFPIEEKPPVLLPLTDWDEFTECYRLRAVERYFIRFGLAEYDFEDMEIAPVFPVSTFVKTALCDRVLEWKNPSRIFGDSKSAESNILHFPEMTGQRKDRERILPDERFFRLKIQLKHIKPPIWRRFIVPANIKLEALHEVIQAVMGWEDEHPYMFRIGDKRYDCEDIQRKRAGIGTVGLAELIDFNGAKFEYVYDFGDNWMHELTIEDNSCSNPEPTCPFHCLKARRACPPENIGGPYSYMHLCHDIEHPETEIDENNVRFVEWFGEFDPKFVSLPDINMDLAFLHEEMNQQMLSLPTETMPP